MQNWLNRSHLRVDEIEVRPALQSDRPAIYRVTESSRRIHFNLDWWTFDHWLYPDRASDAIWLATRRTEVLGLLLAPVDESPSVWLRALAIADGYPAEPILAALLDRALPTLRAGGINQVTALAHPEWLADWLPAAQFTALTEVITFRKDDRILTWPSGKAIAAVIRPATPQDIPAIVVNDHAAFDPVWWHSPKSIAHALQVVSHFSVAELEGQVVGHAFSDLYGEQGHLIRLAVHPAFQRHGLGEQLAIESLNYQIAVGAFPFTVNTQSDNLPSQALYRRLGYSNIGQPVRVMHRMISEN
jgi:ribosomal-protein-alanine N-acetyltransferase